MASATSLLLFRVWGWDAPRMSLASVGCNTKALNVYSPPHPTPQEYRNKGGRNHLNSVTEPCLSGWVLMAGQVRSTGREWSWNRTQRRRILMVKSGCNPRAMLPRTSRQKENEEVFLFSKQNIACNTNNSVTAIFFFFLP